jgi:hypothetical protein
MGPGMVVVPEILRQAGTRFAGTGIIMQIDFLILHTPPEPFHKDVVQRPAFAIHADLHAGSQQHTGVERTGEMAALIAVPDRRRRLRQRTMDSGHHERLRQALIQFPTDDVTREPVQYRHQIHPAGAQPHVGDVDTPDVIGPLGRHIPQQVGVDRRLLCSFAQVGAGAEAGQPHLVHMPGHSLVIDQDAFAPQLRGDAADAVIGAIGVDGVDPMLERHLLRRWRHSRVVQAGAVQAEQVGLRRQRQLGILPLQQRQPFSFRQRGVQLFFSATSIAWIACRSRRRVREVVGHERHLWRPGRVRLG